MSNRFPHPASVPQQRHNPGVEPKTQAETLRELNRGKGQINKGAFGAWEDAEVTHGGSNKVAKRMDLASIQAEQKREAEESAAREELEERRDLVQSAAGDGYTTSFDDENEVILTSPNGLSVRATAANSWLDSCSLQSPFYDDTWDSAELERGEDESLEDFVDRTMWSAAVFQAYRSSDEKLNDTEQVNVNDLVISIENGVPMSRIFVADKRPWGPGEEESFERRTEAVVNFNHATGEITVDDGSGGNDPTRLFPDEDAQAIVDSITGGKSLGKMLTSYAKNASELHAPFISKDERLANTPPTAREMNARPSDVKLYP